MARKKWEQPVQTAAGWCWACSSSSWASLQTRGPLSPCAFHFLYWMAEQEHEQKLEQKLEQKQKQKQKLQA